MKSHCTLARVSRSRCRWLPLCGEPYCRMSFLPRTVLTKFKSHHSQLTCAPGAGPSFLLLLSCGSCLETRKTSGFDSVRQAQKHALSSLFSSSITHLWRHTPRNCGAGLLVPQREQTPSSVRGLDTLKMPNKCFLDEWVACRVSVLVTRWYQSFSGPLRS